MSQENIESPKQPGNYQVMLPPEYYYQKSTGDVSLFDLLVILWNRKYWIAAITGAITILAIIIAFTLVHYYKAEAFVILPQKENVEALNLYGEKKLDESGSVVKLYTPGEVFRQSIRNLQSRNYRWLFFRKENLAPLYKGLSGEQASERDIFESEFNPAFEISVEQEVRSEKERVPIRAIISFEFTDSRKAAEIVNNYVHYINQATIEAMLGDIRGTVRLEKRRLERDIARARQDAFLMRQDKITQIKEQLMIARKLNITSSKLMVNNFGAGFNKGNGESYIEGTRTLEVKLDALKKRKSDDPYIPDLRKLQARLALLKEVNIDKKNLRALTVDQEASVPKIPVRPSRRNIVIMGFVAGLMVSMLIVFIWHFVEKYREEQQANPV